MSQENAKRSAAGAAAKLVEPNMVIGLGTGSTAREFIQALSQKCKSGLKIQAVASSQDSAQLASQLNIPLLDINDVSHIDLTVDGADEVDPQFRMIKGGGGAHVREKILASSSNRICILVDPSKLVEKLGKRPLPVEVIPYGSPATRQKIEQIGLKGAWRQKKDGSLWITENGNYLFDIHFDTPPLFPEEVDLKLRLIPGVVDTGFFFHLVDVLIIGHSDGTAETRHPPA